MSFAPSRHPLRQLALLATALVVLVGLVFHATLRHGFVNFDDNQYVYENSAVQGGMSAAGITWAFTQRHSHNWHPLTWISHMSDVEWFGMNPTGHHATSVALHALNAVLLFLLVRKLTGDIGLGFFVAAIFAVHPLRVESVAWISERKDVLSGAFFFLTLLAYVRWIEGGRQPLGYALALFLFACGLMSKPMLVTLPVVLLLLDYWPLQRGAGTDAVSGWSLVREKIPFALMSAASCVVTVFAQRDAVASFESLPIGLRLGNAAISVLVYLKQLFLPLGLVPYYPFPFPAVVPVKGGLSLFALIGITFLVFKVRRSRPYLLMGWLWYLVMLLPVIGIVQVGEQAHADRYTYLPHVGVLLALGFLAKQTLLPHLLAPRLAAGMLGGVVVCYGGLAWRQANIWRDSHSLWEHTLAVTRRNDLAHLNFGHVLLEAGRVEEAIQQFHRALQIRPQLAEAHNNIATVLMDQGRQQEALTAFEQALRAKPDHAEANNNYATLLASIGRVDEAAEHFQRALKSQPDYPEVDYNFGNLLAAQGRLEEAIAHYQRALHLRPHYAKALFGWGAALVLQRKPAAALEKFQAALRFDPQFAAAHYHLGLLLLSLQREADAVLHWERAVAIQPNLAEAHYRLALVWQRQGKIAAALEHYEKAVTANPGHLASHNNLAWMLATSASAEWRDGSRAVQHALRAVELAAEAQPEVFDTLAAAQAEAGDFAAALATLDRAQSWYSRHPQVALPRSLEEHRQRYAARQPLRIAP